MGNKYYALQDYVEVGKMTYHDEARRSQLKNLYIYLLKYSYKVIAAEELGGSYFIAVTDKTEGSTMWRVVLSPVLEDKQC